MKGAFDPSKTGWVALFTGEGRVVTGVLPAVTLTHVPTIILILDVCATTHEGDGDKGDCKRLCWKAELETFVIGTAWQDL